MVARKALIGNWWCEAISLIEFGQCTCSQMHNILLIQHRSICTFRLGGMFPKTLGFESGHGDGRRGPSLCLYGRWENPSCATPLRSRHDSAAGGGPLTRGLRLLTTTSTKKSTLSDAYSTGKIRHESLSRGAIAMELLTTAKKTALFP